MKNKMAVAVIAVCVVATALTVIRNLRPDRTGVASLPRGEQVWIRCNAPDCGAASQMDRRDYFEEVERRIRANPRLEGLPSSPPISCPTCRKETAVRAVRCEQCDHLFVYGLRKGGQFDYADRCPECGHSAAERGAQAGR